MRVYGYTYYSDWIENGPMMSLQPYAYYDSGDYEINNHTRGISALLHRSDQPAKPVQAEGSYTTATGARIYNEQMFHTAAYGNEFAVLVNANHPLSGTCYSHQRRGVTVHLCDDVLRRRRQRRLLRAQPTLPAPKQPRPAQCERPRCGSGPCAYYVVENGDYGLNNTVTPSFLRLLDHRPVAPQRPPLLQLRSCASTTTLSSVPTPSPAPARDFWFNAFNQDTCFNKQTLTLVDRSALIGGRAGARTRRNPALRSAASTSQRTCKIYRAPSTTTSRSRASA